MRILAIDDKENQLLALSEMLQTFIPGCKTATASSGKEGLELARAFQPDAIILDLKMPGMNGFQVCQALKSDFVTQHIPVIFLTGSATDSTTRVHGFEIGADAFLIHPVEPSELVSQVRAMVRIKRAEDALRAEKVSVDCMLRETREHQTAILHAARDAFFIMDLKGRFLDVNGAACQLTGYSREELLQMTVADLEPDETPAEIVLHMERIKQVGGMLFQRRQRCKDGHLIHVELSVSYLPNSKERMFAFVRDITERKQAEKALQESEERFGQLFENSPVATWLEDLTRLMAWMRELRTQGVKDVRAYLRNHPEQLQHALTLIRVLKVNRAAVMQNAAVDKQDLIENLPRLFRRETHQSFIEEVAALWLGRTNFEFESQGGRMDGRTLCVIVHVYVPLKEGVPDYSSVIITGTDITERKQAEAILRLKSAALEAAANAIVITDPTGKIEWVNAAFTACTGYTAAEVVGQNPRMLKSDKQEFGFYRDMWNTVVAGKNWQGEIINRRKDGTFFTEDMTITPLKDERGKITHFIAVKQDITQRKLLEEEFRQSQKMEAFGQLAGGVAHDFNNILTVIQGNTSLLQMDFQAAEKEEILQQILQATQRAAGLVSQLLAFSRRQIMRTRTLNLNEEMVNVEKMLQRIIGEHITLQTRLLPGTAAVQADPGMIEQVLLNLVINARDAMSDGGELSLALESIRLDDAALAHHPLGRLGDFICMSVRDTGSGIAPEVLPHIFEPFFTTKDVGKGTGLGLATVHGIVAQHHGWVEVWSELGKGTQFRVYLPQLADARQLADEQEATRQVRGGSETILLVEDEVALRVLAARALAHYGYHVIEAASGARALEQWRKHGGMVNLLLTDIIMPDGVSGGQLAKQLQAENPGLKVIYMSGYPGEVAGQGLNLRDGENFLQKPFTPAKLGQTVRASLDAR